MSEISDKFSMSTVPLGAGEIDDARAGLERGFEGETFLSGDRRRKETLPGGGIRERECCLNADFLCGLGERFRFNRR